MRENVPRTAIKRQGMGFIVGNHGFLLSPPLRDHFFFLTHPVQTYQFLYLCYPELIQLFWLSSMVAR